MATKKTRKIQSSLKLLTLSLNNDTLIAGGKGGIRAMSEANKPLPDAAAPPSSKSDKLPKIVSTQELFDGDREICIEHDGETYRLRITRRNKLILQK